MPHFEKRVTLRKMGHTWDNGALLKKWVTLEKITSHLEKWVALGKMGHTWKKWITLEKMGHT